MKRKTLKSLVPAAACIAAALSAPLAPVSAAAEAAPAVRAAQDPDAIADKAGLKFAPGSRLERPNNIGEAYIKPLLRPEGVYRMKGTNLLTFAPGARSAWHSHGGMYVIALEGIGMYQEEGKKPQILRKGDVVQIPAGTRHWHGAAPGSWFSQLVVWDSAWKPSAGTPKSAPVTDAQYAAPAEEFTGRTASGNHAFTFAHGTQRLPLSHFSGPAYAVNAVPAGNVAGSPAMGWVLFEPSVINRWHRHPGGQIIIVTDGVGFNQVRGKPAEILHPGDIAFCPPGEEHWHGAAEGTYFAHLAIGTNPGSAPAQWLEPVSAEAYQAAQKALKEKR
jgi:quercetin dioxygenase-like cupin family protein